ncbi:hypothetical protein ACPEEZ_08945 [Frigoribacterium sp. 2-23]|uniref:hypothetical protein n=1 Tax=Frigoribacterium sp. 2-23 TaxID=3415006 RepID=UPI003C701D0C
MLRAGSSPAVDGTRLSSTASDVAESTGGTSAIGGVSVIGVRDAVHNGTDVGRGPFSP